MNISKIFAGTGVLVIAAIGAFASAQNVTTNTYWYKPSALAPCTSLEVEFTCIESLNPTCIAPVTAPVPGAQLYLTDDCDRILERI